MMTVVSCQNPVERTDFFLGGVRNCITSESTIDFPDCIRVRNVSGPAKSEALKAFLDHKTRDLHLRHRGVRLQVSVTRAKAKF